MLGTFDLFNVPAIIVLFIINYCNEPYLVVT